MKYFRWLTGRPYSYTSSLWYSAVCIALASYAASRPGEPWWYVTLALIVATYHLVCLKCITRSDYDPDVLFRKL